MLLDFAIISALLVAAHLVRSRIQPLQALLLPTSVLAGLLALAGGQQGAQILPFSETARGESAMAGYPKELIAVLFATLYLGSRPKSPGPRAVLRSVGDTFFYNAAAYLGQFGAALLFGLYVLAPLFPDLNPAFALMLPAGFAGGHGTATVIGAALEQQGWSDAVNVGYAFATLGLLIGIAGGMLLINLGARFGWTRLVKSAAELPAEERSGFLPRDQQPPLGRETVSPIALDPLAWHVALVLAALAAAHLADHVWQGWFAASLPLFVLAMLAGAALQAGLNAVKLGEFVDRRIAARIGSSASDYLVAFGIGSIKLSVVAKYAAPIAVLALFGLAWCLVLFWFLGRRLCRNFWFERSLFVYGWATGIVGIGIILLRVVDPKFRSRTVEDYGLAYLLLGPIEVALLVILPPLVARGWIAAPAAVLLALFAACIALSARWVGWFSASPTELRAGEREAIQASEAN